MASLENYKIQVGKKTTKNMTLLAPISNYGNYWQIKEGFYFLFLSTLQIEQLKGKTLIVFLNCKIIGWTPPCLVMMLATLIKTYLFNKEMIEKGFSCLLVLPINLLP